MRSKPGKELDTARELDPRSKDGSVPLRDVSTLLRTAPCGSLSTWRKLRWLLPLVMVLLVVIVPVVAAALVLVVVLVVVVVVVVMVVVVAES